MGLVVLPMVLQTPSAPSILSLIPPLGTPLGTLCSVQWLASSIHLCICQDLAEPLRRQLYQAPVIKYFLASTIVSGFGDYMGWIPRWNSLCMSFPSVSALHLVSIFPPMSIFFPLLRRTLVFLLELPVVYELYLGHCEIWG